MSDREMLELAAKAAGMTIDTHYVDGGASAWAGERHNSDWIPNWNPRDNNDDSFRLMVKLRLEPRFIDNSYSNGIEPSRVTLHNISGIVEEVGNDPCAATRRAIFRVAAEIGRAMG